MSVDQLATETGGNGGGIEAGHADHHEPAGHGVTVAREIAVNTAADSLHHIGQRLAGHIDPALGAKHAEFAGDGGDLLLERLGILDRPHRNHMRVELVMAVIMMMMVIMVMVIVMMMVVVRMLGTGMRLRFHLEAKDDVHRCRAARYWNDRGWGLELVLDR